MAHEFVAAGAAAQHCAELTGHGAARGLRPEDRAAIIAAWRRDLAQVLADDLSPLLSGDRLDVTIAEPEPLSGADALRRIGPMAANSLIRCGGSAGGDGETALLSFDFATALALTDRSFGGDGRMADGVPELLPRSAALMVDEAAAMIAGGITRVSFGNNPPPSGGAADGEVIIRSDSAARLKPFGLDAPCAAITITIANRHGGEWRATLALAAERLDRLLPGTARPARGGNRPPATGMAAPFAAVPLPLHVVLAEFDLSLARLQTLAPGDRILLAMGRQVPLMVGDKLIAHGSIGTAEDHMAIRLTRVPVPISTSLEGVAR